MAASTDVTGDHLEIDKEVNDQMQEISVQRPTLCAKYFEHRDGFEDKELKHEYFDEIHQANLGNNLKSEYSDIIHDGSLGNNDSKLGPTLNLKQVREKKKKTRCRDTCTERVHHESFGNRDSKVGPCPTLKEVRKKDKKNKGAKKSTLKRYITRVLATRALGTRTTNVDRLEKLKICSLSAS